MSRFRTFRAPALALTFGALSLSLASCGDDEGAEVTPGPVAVEDAGAEDGRVELPGSAEVGQTGSSAATIDMRLGIEGGGGAEEVPVSVRLDYDAEVVEADTAGYVVENTFTGAEVLDAPAGADFSVLEDLVGVRYRELFNPDGTSDDTELVDEDQLTSAQREAYEQFGSQVESTAFDFPDEPVGVGARWTSVSTVEQQGFDLTVTYHYELTALEGDRYTVEISYDEDIDDTFSVEGQDADVTGSLEGGGTTTGIVGNPLAFETSLEQDLEMDIEADGQSLSMTMSVAVTVEPVPA